MSKKARISVGLGLANVPGGGSGRRQRWCKNFSVACRHFLLLSLVAGLPAPLFAQDASREYQLKAVCLVRFAQFVEWPARAFPNTNTPIVIGVLGEDPFGKNLEEASRQVGPIRNRPFAVERYRRTSDIRTCHILFISRSEDPQLDRILTDLRSRPVLTVGETEGFAQRGGIIRFLTVENKLRFRVNLGQARDRGLELSSKLLRWADIMGAPP